MPGKLLRVALVAAVIPALTPIIVSAQTGVPKSPVRTASTAPAAKTAAPTLWQRLRGQKPTAAPAAKIVQVAARKPAAPASESASPFQLEGNADIEMLRSRSNRARPSTSDQASQPVEHLPVLEQVQEPVASPIDRAAPPMDVTAEYSAPKGEAPRYDRMSMYAPAAPTNDVKFARPVPGRPISQAMNGAQPVYPVQTYEGTVGVTRLDGAMYPSPQPGIPLDVGSTMITNPALDPHEMLYAHRYRGLYGPFYHKTYRSWIMTPFGICKSEKRVLMGTEVRVNYKSHISPISLFFPPVTH